MAEPLLRFSAQGIYCPVADVYIDPWRSVSKAIITHAHSDHARYGSQHYLAHHHSAPALKLRLGASILLQTINYNEPILMNGVKISLHPAGHIIGSAQVRLEYRGEVWVVSGDYKTEDDGLSGAFEPVRCHTFITESTFGLPVYRWHPQEKVFIAINQWWQNNKNNGRQSVITAYSLGKAQRVLQYLDRSIGPVVAHSAIYNTQEALANNGLPVARVKRFTVDIPRQDLQGALVIAPPSAINSPWLRRFEPYSIGVCSGWMQIRGNMRRRNVDAGFALSDHADWNGLLQAVKETGAQRVFVTHGYQEVFSRYLCELGIDAREVKTEFGGEEGEDTLLEEIQDAG